MKKKLSKLLIMALCVAMLPVPEGKAASKPTVTKSMDLTVGQSKTVKVKGSQIKKKIFASSNKKVASVTQKGKVSAKKSGNCKITIKVTYKKSKTAKKYTTKKYTCKVSVKDKAASTPMSTPDTTTTNPPNSSNLPAPNTSEPSGEPVGTLQPSGEPAETLQPSGTPDVNVKKNENDVKVLTELIQQQKELGAIVSENLNSEEYVWEKISDNDTEARLVKIVWSAKGMQGDISFEGLEKLGYLDCSFNKLVSLDVSKNTVLVYLFCDENELTSLDVSSNMALTWLGCSHNELTSLDVSSNTALESLSCGSNKLTSLDVSKNTALWYLFCSENELTSLDVSSNTALTWLSCVSNKLISLDVSKNISLTSLFCDSTCNVIGYSGDVTS